jgi:putative sugar O-methyltransferase
VKSKYLLHPIRTAKTAKAMFATRLGMWKFAKHGELRFKGDHRYNLQNVTDGFASRIDTTEDDTELLERICAAYSKAIERQQFAPRAYRATDWWQQVRQHSLGPVIQALLTRDIPALRAMYRNFFRHSCSTGLLGAPFGMAKAYFGGNIKDLHCRFYLSHVLYRYDYWKAQTNGRFPLSDLYGPGVGNPFGVQIDGTHIHVGAEYAHYCAHRIDGVLPTGAATVVEIGGGYGSMAYYLLRDRAGLTYLDFDVPESIALISYYLLKAFPNLKFLLYGEEELTSQAIAGVDVVLMPTFEIAAMPAASIDVTFSSHAMSDLSAEAMEAYLNNIDRMTRDAFFCIGKKQASESISDLIDRRHRAFQLAETRSSGWHSHKISGAGVGGAAGLAASTMFEQLYRREKSHEPLQEVPLAGQGGHGDREVDMFNRDELRDNGPCR